MKAHLILDFHGLGLDVTGEFFNGTNAPITPQSINPNDPPEFELHSVTFAGKNLLPFLENAYVGDGAGYKSAVSELEQLCAQKCIDQL